MLVESDGGHVAYDVKVPIFAGNGGGRNGFWVAFDPVFGPCAYFVPAYTIIDAAVPVVPTLGVVRALEPTSGPSVVVPVKKSLGFRRDDGLDGGFIFWGILLESGKNGKGEKTAQKSDVFHKNKRLKVNVGEQGLSCKFKHFLGK